MKDKPIKKEVKETAEYIALNRCRRCGIKTGRFIEKDTGKKVGVYLLTDARGYMMCNICRDKGFFMGKAKTTKKERKEQKAIKRELRKMVGIPHVTYDAGGKKV